MINDVLEGFSISVEFFRKRNNSGVIVNKTKKICIIGPSVDTNKIGGVATHVKNLKALACFHDAMIIDPGSVHSSSKTSILIIAKNIVTLRKMIVNGEYSHVLVNTSIYLGSFIKLLMILGFLPLTDGIEIHVFFHGGRFPSLNPNICRMINRLLCSLILKVKEYHFLSEIQLEGFSRLFPKCVTEIYTNYSTSDEIIKSKRDYSDNVLKLLFVGRVVREKGVFELLSAIEKFAKEKDKINLTIVGDGPDLPELIEKGKILPKDFVHFAGHLAGEKLEWAYRDADVVILPTYHPEGFPYTFIEAMCAGKPIISTGEGALEILVEDGINGFKVRAKDVDSIVGAIKRVIRNGPLLEKMSKNCHRYFQEKLSRSAAEKYYLELMS